MYMGSQTFALRTLLKAYIRYKYAINMFRIYTETYEDDRPKLYGNNYRAHIVQTTGSSSQHFSLLVSINQFSAFVNVDLHSFLNRQLGQLSWSASVEVLKRKSNYKVIEQVINVFAVLKTVCKHISSVYQSQNYTLIQSLIIVRTSYEHFSKINMSWALTV